LHLVGARHADAEPSAQGSDRQGELVERDRHPLVHRLLDRELVVPGSQVLHEAVPSDDHPGAAILLEAPDQTKPCLQSAVIRLDRLLAYRSVRGHAAGSSSSNTIG
jgi:hypothetical protein